MRISWEDDWVSDVWVSRFHEQSEKLPQGLVDDINACGYFPQLVRAAVSMAVGGEPCLSWLVHQEATFANETIHRHLTVVVLTPTRLVIDHTDDGDVGYAETQAITSTETVNLRHINSVSLSQVVASPEGVGEAIDSAVEAWLTIGWAVMSKLELEPATCGNPECDADHGYSGALMADDLTIRMSETADGKKSLDQLIRFTTALQQTTAGVK